MLNLEIDIETFSSVNLAKAGVYRYAESPDFEVLLFGYSVDGGEVKVGDLVKGEKIPEEVMSALEDEAVTKWAFNAQFERICISRMLGYEAGTYLVPASWKCSMVWSAYMGLASLCAALVTPGSNGENREKIMESPLEWWRSWKEMLGNKNIDPRIYDVLGELIVLKTMIPLGEDISWNGPDHASYDIEMESKFVEVKSTIARDKREVTISSHFQLQPENKPLHLVLCQFEPSFLTGVSIDSVIDDISKLGYNTFFIEKKLQEMGFENGMSSRKKTFILHDLLDYEIDDDFPRITTESFKGGVLPVGITKITYTVDLSGIQVVSLLQGADNDI